MMVFLIYHRVTFDGDDEDTDFDRVIAAHSHAEAHAIWQQCVKDYITERFSWEYEYDNVEADEDATEAERDAHVLENHRYDWDIWPDNMFVLPGIPNSAGVVHYREAQLRGFEQVLHTSEPHMFDVYQDSDPLEVVAKAIKIGGWKDTTKACA